MLTDATIAAGPNTASKPTSFLADHGSANAPPSGAAANFPLPGPPRAAPSWLMTARTVPYVRFPSRRH